MLGYVSAAAYGGVALAAWRLHARLRSEGSRWALTTFAILFGVSASGLVLPESRLDASLPLMVLRDVLVSALVFFPYALYRFARGFRPAPAAADGAALAGAVALTATIFALPPLPENGQPLAPAATAFLGSFLVYWTVLSLWVTATLWRGGKGQPGVSRRRMRLLALGTLAMNLALLLAGARPSSEIAAVVTQLIAVGAAGMFLLGFAPPAALRHIWRQEDDRELRLAKANLMSATTREDVAATIVGRVAQLLGGHGAALVADDGTVLAATGLRDEDLAGISEQATERIERHRLVLPLRTAVLVVQSGPYAPFFGEEEVELLRSHGTFVDLALGRIASQGREHRTRKELERTNEELTALVYGISHDLRSPIVTVMGYLELLQSDASDALDDDAKHYLERISISARYMDALIRDLLELSRIGRTQTETETVELESVVRDIADEMELSCPDATVRVRQLPSVAMNAIRARQLFTNLIENALRHGGRSDITVTVAGGVDDATAVITVADDGVGIPRAYRERVFGIFERLDGDVGSPSAGTGIGLAMCRKIVEQVDGSIQIDPSDVGTTFTIRLPAAAVQQPVPAEVQRR